jgi:orotate phosphoribosyltransferase
MPYAFNRKEIKDHGEGGLLVGAELKGRVLIVDDVITAGTSVRESVEIIQSVGAEPVGVIIALNRQEKGADDTSAIQDVSIRYGLPVISIICLEDIVDYLTKSNDTLHLDAINAYQLQYGCGV